VNRFIVLLCVGFGGGLGATCRHLLVELFHGVMGMPPFAAVMIVNITGCFLIGIIVMLLEGTLCRDGTSRLKNSAMAKSLADRKWWPDGDNTLPVVDQFRMNQHLEFLGGFLVTGLLGGMTTFSLFSLLSLNLVQADQWGWALFNGLGSVAIGLIAVMLGMYLGRALVPRN
jgi:CrcB protein